MTLTTYIKQYPVSAFILFTLVLSLAILLLPIPPESAFALVAFLLIPIPTIVAFVLVAFLEGRPGLRAFVRESFQWHLSLTWLGIAFGLGFIIHFGSSILALLLGRMAAIEIAAPSVFFIVVFPLALLEEIGWRGFALRRLLRRHSPFAAALITGIPWALLHFVLFLVLVPDVSPIAEMLVVFLFSLPLTWIYVRSGYSILVATILHGALNAFPIVGAGIPPAEVLWFVCASAAVLNGCLLLLDRRIWFTVPAAASFGQTVPSVS